MKGLESAFLMGIMLMLLVHTSRLEASISKQASLASVAAHLWEAGLSAQPLCISRKKKADPWSPDPVPLSTVNFCSCLIKCQKGLKKTSVVIFVIYLESNRCPGSPEKLSMSDRWDAGNLLILISIPQGTCRKQIIRAVSSESAFFGDSHTQ